MKSYDRKYFSNNSPGVYVFLEFQFSVKLLLWLFRLDQSWVSSHTSKSILLFQHEELNNGMCPFVLCEGRVGFKGEFGCHFKQNKWPDITCMLPSGERKYIIMRCYWIYKGLIFVVSEC